MQDGWFLTGDLGLLGPGGFLHITGRKKDIIVTSGGKNVQPAGLEEIVQRHPAVAQCVVVGDRRPFIAALVAVSAEWLAAHPNLTEAEIAAAVDEAVAAANETVSRAESIRAWRRLPAELSVEGGALTATLKVRRQVVANRFAGLLDDIYRAAEH
jgi:long-chain acyl-CoA synthetase